MAVRDHQNAKHGAEVFHPRRMRPYVSLLTEESRLPTYCCPVANFYLVQTEDGTEELTADFYERKEEDWAFVLAGHEVYRIEMDDVVSIATAPL